MCDCNQPHCTRRSTRSSVEAVRRRINPTNSDGNLPQPAGASVTDIKDITGPSRPSGPATGNISNSGKLTLQTTPQSSTIAYANENGTTMLGWKGADDLLAVDDAHQAQQQNSYPKIEVADATLSVYDVNDAPTPQNQQQSRARNTQNDNPRAPCNIQNPS